MSLGVVVYYADHGVILYRENELNGACHLSQPKRIELFQDLDSGLLSFCPFDLQDLVDFGLGMNGLRRLLSLARPAIPMTRRILPPTIGTLGVYIFMQGDSSFNFVNQIRQYTTDITNINLLSSVMTAKAEAKYKCQDMVIEQDKAHELFLIIHLDSGASPKECLKALQNIKGHVDRISPLDIRDEDNEVIFAIAFGPEFLDKVYPNAKKNGVEPFEFKERRGKNSTMPSTGGDILVHATCGEKGKLFELAQAVLADMPESAIKKVEEEYGFVYRNGRDLSGFIDGTENPADEDERIEVAQSKVTGGSYVLTQKWQHDLKKIRNETRKVMESKIGRTEEDSIEIKPIAPTSHVGRMTHGLSDEESENMRIVRHSLPYGIASGQCGLFFIAYSKTPKTLDWMLDRMAGLMGDRIEDGLFHFTTATTGTYFYSPSKLELEKIFKEGCTTAKKFSPF
nr:iron dependent peroxidase [Hymenolepis microstoma]